MTPVWLAAIIRAVRPLLPADFIGRIEINVFKGGVANATVIQSFRAEGGDDDAPPPAPSPGPRPPRRSGSLTRLE